TEFLGELLSGNRENRIGKTSPEVLRHPLYRGAPIRAREKVIALLRFLYAPAGITMSSCSASIQLIRAEAHSSQRQAVRSRSCTWVPNGYPVDSAACHTMRASLNDSTTSRALRFGRFLTILLAGLSERLSFASLIAQEYMWRSTPIVVRAASTPPIGPPRSPAGRLRL